MDIANIADIMDIANIVDIAQLCGCWLNECRWGRRAGRAGRAERGGPDDRAWRAGAQSRRTGGPGGQAGRTVDADLEA